MTSRNDPTAGLAWAIRMRREIRAAAAQDAADDRMYGPADAEPEPASPDALIYSQGAGLPDIPERRQP